MLTKYESEPIRVVGMVIYTYAVLEERLDSLWAWLQHVEAWAGHSFAWYNYSPRSKYSLRFWKATDKNRARLYERLAVEQPWSSLVLQWPAANQWTRDSRGFQVEVVSWSQPGPSRASYRVPSLVYVEAHADAFRSAPGGVRGFLDLGMEAWEIVDGVYGFVDVETGIPLQDDIHRNAMHGNDNYVLPAYQPEVARWQRAVSYLDKRVWKAFWGNLLGAEHLRQLGGIHALRRADPRYRRLPEYEERAYRQGAERLRACECHEEWRALANDGVLLTLSPSPLDWFDPLVRHRWERLQSALGRVALGEWDDEGFNVRELD